MSLSSKDLTPCSQKFLSSKFLSQRLFLNVLFRFHFWTATKKVERDQKRIDDDGDEIPTDDVIDPEK